jgi:hypothetical protein
MSKFVQFSSETLLRLPSIAGATGEALTPLASLRLIFPGPDGLVLIDVRLEAVIELLGAARLDSGSE